MRLTDELFIAPEKLTDYLLIAQPRNDKARFLAQAGFTRQNPGALDAAIRLLVRDNDAAIDRVDEYGTFYRVSGVLMGTSADLKVVTVWLRTAQETHYRFITLKPDKE